MLYFYFKYKKMGWRPKEVGTKLGGGKAGAGKNKIWKSSQNNKFLNAGKRLNKS